MGFRSVQHWHLMAAIGFITHSACAGEQNGAACVLTRTEAQGQLNDALALQDIPSSLLLLKIIVDDAVSKGYEAPNYNLCDIQLPAGKELCKDNKNIRRIAMPQLIGKPVPGSPASRLPQDSRGEVNGNAAFADFLAKKKRYVITDEWAPVLDLKATQNEIVGTEVANIWYAIRDPRGAAYREIFSTPLWISADNYILDGHHRWAATVARALSNGTIASATLHVKKVHAPIEALVADAREFVRIFGIKPAAGLDQEEESLIASKPDVSQQLTP